MEFSGTVTVKQSRQQVWEFLLTPQAVTACVPNLRQWQAVGERQFTAEFVFHWGDSHVAFNSDIEWWAVAPPSQARMQVQGKSGQSNFYTNTHMELTEVFTHMTQIKWAVQADLQGKMAQLPAPFVKTAVLVGINKFFNNVKHALELAR